MVSASDKPSLTTSVCKTSSPTQLLAKGCRPAKISIFSLVTQYSVALRPKIGHDVGGSICQFVVNGAFVMNGYGYTQYRHQWHWSAVYRYIVGLAGPPGSGKSTLANEVVHRLNVLWHQRDSGINHQIEPADIAVVVPMDGFHLYRSQLDMMERKLMQEEEVRSVFCMAVVEKIRPITECVEGWEAPSKWL
eukprot:Gb_31224 [translate_table: standard]